MHHLSFLQAIVLGLLQGVSELFPISSLGHSVLVPALIGGSWKDLVTQQSASASPYLTFIVALHVATALALLCFFWRDWVALIRGFFTSIGKRRAETVHEKMAWLIVIATIPAGALGLGLEHTFRTIFAKPEAAAVFLTVNGLILIAGERLRRRAVARAGGGAVTMTGSVPGIAGPGPASPAPAGPAPAAGASGAAGAVPRRAHAAGTVVDAEHDSANDVAVVAQVRTRDAAVIGVFQSLALLAGISRSGITMVGGLIRGLDHEQAVRFGFLLATPIIFAAGVLKLPELAGAHGDGIRGQALVGAVAAFLAALASTKFLVRWFRTRTLTPFAVYCLAFGLFCVAWFA